MARHRKLDETDRRIIDIIRDYRALTDEGPRLQDIADRADLKLGTVHYRINAKLVPAGLVKHDPWGRGTLEVVDP